MDGEGQVGSPRPRHLFFASSICPVENASGVDAKRNSVVKCIGFGCPLPKLLIRCAQSSCGEATWLVSLM